MIWNLRKKRMLLNSDGFTYQAEIKRAEKKEGYNLRIHFPYFSKDNFPGGADIFFYSIKSAQDYCAKKWQLRIT